MKLHVPPYIYILILQINVRNFAQYMSGEPCVLVNADHRQHRSFLT